MPPPTFPPTPASSTDIKGKDGTDDLPSLQMSFELPPPALASPSPTEARFRAGAGASRPDYPMQPSEAVKSRRRSSAANPPGGTRGFELPPPPTRSRKIIQMKPKKQEEEEEEEEEKEARRGTGGKASGGKAAAASGAAAGKKKQPSATSAAGRKIARKTAHSLIERRRRSKMNEEFAVLKGMIPACTGEMHKLAILQASIEYVRYLEDCVSKLKAQRDEDAAASERQSSHSRAHTPTAHHHRDGFPAPGQRLPSLETHHYAGDVEMTGSAEATPSPTYTDAPSSHSHRSSVSVSPALYAQDHDRRESYSSSASTDPRRYSYSTSATTSPAFGPQVAYGQHGGGGGATLPPIGLALTSPALGPRGPPQGQQDADQEATAALLMLNTDRRGYFGQGGSGDGEEGRRARGSGRGMSVRDLLST